MLDISFIGKDGFIIQYEDIISLWGYNVLLTLKDKKLIQGMSDEDILLDYFNREIEDPFEYIRTKYKLVFPIKMMYESEIVLRPNLLYAFKIIDAAFKNGIKDIIVYSKQYSKIIKEYIINMIPGDVKYMYGDIVPILIDHPNCTYLTSSVSNIDTIKVSSIPPFALTIVDDFMYVAPTVKDDYVEALREKGVFVGFTGILSAGLIK